MDLSNIFDKFSDYTMVPRETYIRNLELISDENVPDGAIVECGVWKGGMIAGIANLFGNDRSYYLFDSFEGLPPAKDIDGAGALSFQADPPSEANMFNLAADQTFAESAMSIALDGDFSSVSIVKGWFKDSIAETVIDKPIAVLRLDADWYDSTLICLDLLFPKMANNGILIIDDYIVLDGCSRAVHDYLSKNRRPEKIRQFNNDVIYIQKSEPFWRIEDFFANEA
ncbi:MAG: TylF/MycF/NovP-related O-methyltransferase [Pyrinomonadaceae bacterium]